MLTNQDIVDAIEVLRCARILPIGIREGLIDAIWFYLSDNRADPTEDSE